MNEKTRNFLVNRFQAYYSQAEIHLPPEHISREWGFISFSDSSETFMKRHIAFGSEGEITDYLKGMGPSHSYYSVAYYEYPSAPKMKEKNWQKADLIFDIDSDHLPGKMNSYAEMLENGKKETFKLMEFLLDDFGFAEKDVHIVFSGGRGYHCHITDPSVLHLESPERREIVDYVSAKGIDIERILSTREVSGDAGRESAQMMVFPSGTEGGWRGRINRYFVSFMKDIVAMDKAEEVLMGFKGVGEKTARKIIEVFENEAQVEVLKGGNIDVLSGLNKKVINTLIEEGIKKMSAVVDEPVTADVKRLIRLPGSLHGGSGLKVMSLDINELEKFEPLRDAVVFGDRLVMSKVIKPFAVQMKGKDIEVEQGEQELPEYVAVHLMCRGVAEYG
ncbi:DNA primase catalytic subunit PriS [Methanomethylovorans sp.]|uniref:DNA primase catalytic subunit PriS n=1 Tax=Methanomethylovorans sp. TaxID=2758717 RepID=UPI000A6E6A3F|nr:DNA primase catalytic subunit PriS [Methanomethylovorans sp.]